MTLTYGDFGPAVGTWLYDLFGQGQGQQQGQADAKTPDVAPDDFRQDVIYALWHSHINVSLLDPAALDALVLRLWQDPYLADAYNQDPTSSTAAQLNMASLIQSELFSPSQSTDPSVLSEGIKLRQGQGLPLTAEQIDYLQGLPPDLAARAGISPTLNAIFSPVVSLFRQYFGREPTAQELEALTGFQPPGPQSAIRTGQQAVKAGQVFQGSYPVTLGYGQKFGAETEVGVDYGMPVGTPIYAPFGGTVTVEDDGKSNWGKRIFVHLDNGYTFAVGHLSQFAISSGRVNAGDLIAYSGGDPRDSSSGVSTGPHIEVQWIDPQGQFQDPSAVLGGATISLPNFDMQQIEDRIRGYPSHLSGLDMGHYTDLRKLVDDTSLKYLGHSGTDGIVAELSRIGDTTPGMVKYWYETHSPSQLNDPAFAKAYNAAYAANAPYYKAVYNETGADPRHITPQIPTDPGDPWARPEGQPLPGDQPPLEGAGSRVLQQ